MSFWQLLEDQFLFNFIKKRLRHRIIDSLADREGHEVPIWSYFDKLVLNLLKQLLNEGIDFDVPISIEVENLRLWLIQTFNIEIQNCLGFMDHH